MNETTNGIPVEVGNIYKRRDGLRAFVYYHNPIGNIYQVLIVGASSLFYEVDKNGRYFHDKLESPNDLVEVEQD